MGTGLIAPYHSQNNILSCEKLMSQKEEWQKEQTETLGKILSIQEVFLGLQILSQKKVKKKYIYNNKIKQII